jgi:hypothetical protein
MISKEETITPYTVEKCNSCNKETKRNFRVGDYLFTETTKCSSCNGKMIIEKIYGESLEKKPKNSSQ